MKIVLDATPLTVSTGGLRRYTAELAIALARQYPEDEIWLVSDQRLPVLPEQPINLRRYEGRGGIVEKRWWLFGIAALLRRLGADVFHGTDYAVPYLALRPAVMTLHDLSPWKDETWRAPSNRVRTRTPILLRMGLATMVITPSEAVRKEAINFFRLPAERVVAIPLAAAPSFRPLQPTASRRPYFLHVGTIEPRKNIELLLTAWRGIYRRWGVELVLAGRAASPHQAPAPEPGLQVLGPVSEEDLANLYSGALAVVVPSLYEGFGLPVLEAMQCGTPVFASDDPALRECGGEGAFYIGRSDVHGWGAAMDRAVSEPEWLAAYRERALKRAALFSWEKTASCTRQVYEEAIRRFRL
jgi:alpha-1,3-rhamnosyl/mannosyltransferase